MRSLQTKQTQSLGMARPVQLVSSFILLLCCAAAASASSFDDSNPIRLVSSDGLRDFETSVLQVIGQARHALSFARFSRKHGKIYESVEEMKLRFATFSNNMDLIRSTNRKGLSYRLGLNSKFFILIGPYFRNPAVWLPRFLIGLQLPLVTCVPVTVHRWQIIFYKFVIIITYLRNYKRKPFTLIISHFSHTCVLNYSIWFV